MHDLSEFMKSLLERFTKWFNRTHSRSGHLWEDRFKSVIVESGVAARTMAAYIDLNPVGRAWWRIRRTTAGAAMAKRWAAGRRGMGRRRGKVWCGRISAIREWDLMRKMAGSFPFVSALDGDFLRAKGPGVRKFRGAKGIGQTTKNTAELLESKDNETVLKDLGMAKMLRCRVRYFTDGAVIGSKEFVNEAFAGARERFGPKRKDGARKLRAEARPQAERCGA
jgi:putative transposase